MKKFLIFGITVIMLFSLAACSGENKDPVAGEKSNATSSLGVGNRYAGAQRVLRHYEMPRVRWKSEFPFQSE